MRMPTIALSATALVLTAFTLPTAAYADDDDCRPRAPRGEWLSVAQIETKAKALGYTVRKVEIDDGCYEVYGSKDGKRFEVYLHPKTAEVMKVERDDDRWDDDDRRRGDDDGRRRGDDDRWDDDDDRWDD